MLSLNGVALVLSTEAGAADLGADAIRQPHDVSETAERAGADHGRRGATAAPERLAEAAAALPPQRWFTDQLRALTVSRQFAPAHRTRTHSSRGRRLTGLPRAGAVPHRSPRNWRGRAPPAKLPASTAFPAEPAGAGASPSRSVDGRLAHGCPSSSRNATLLPAPAPPRRRAGRARDPAEPLHSLNPATPCSRSRSTASWPGRPSRLRRTDARAGRVTSR